VYTLAFQLSSVPVWGRSTSTILAAFKQRNLAMARTRPYSELQREMEMEMESSSDSSSDSSQQSQEMGL